ncbi:hypothetical protein [Legionella jordanis]|uniref:Uncharacterized protein n=1 Tax=Legionella jordanis TaxID=456 RepID=A0A0W0V7Z3_9GAMM|nr:hypothetical protein [Legionella jordanis]KTD16191.1 hypothetical protein Ljor_0497 [Legionella jordanis]RMX04587.1 hypothetical protein EAW55_03895 [Legionella jordanis]VEH12351.1 Uncharacterised protein [Legionella jordanis]
MMITIASDVQDARQRLRDFVDSKGVGVIIFSQIQQNKEEEAITLFQEIVRDRREPTVLNLNLSWLSNEFLRRIFNEIEGNECFITLDLDLQTESASSDSFLIVSEALNRKACALKTLKLSALYGSCIPLLAQSLKVNHSLYELHIFFTLLKECRSLKLLDEVFEALILPLEGNKKRHLKTLHISGLPFIPWTDKNTQQLLTQVLQEVSLEKFSFAMNMGNFCEPVDLITSLREFPGEVTLSITMLSAPNPHQRETFELIASISEKLDNLDLKICFPRKAGNSNNDQNDNYRKNLLQLLIHFLKACDPKSSFNFKLDQKLIFDENENNRAEIAELKHLLSQTAIKFNSSFLSYRPSSLQNSQATFFNILAKAKKIHLERELYGQNSVYQPGT